MSAVDNTNVRRWKALLLALAVAAGANAAAVDHLRVIGLFKGSALVRIDGQQRLLRAGQRSPEGVKLIRADSRTAVLEIDGRTVELGLDRSVGGHYREPAASPEVRIYRNPRGMFRTVGTINRLPVNFLVDTGATQVAMNAAQARRLGVDYRVEGKPAGVSTASGYARAYAVKLDSVKVGEIELSNVDALVIEGNHLTEVLLGMSFLGRVEMTNSKEVLVLRKKY